MNTISPRYPKIPDKFKDYYRIRTPEEIAEYDDDFAYQWPILDGYRELFYGWAVAKEDSPIFDALVDNGVGEVIIGWTPDRGFNLYEVVGDRLYYIDDEVDQAIRDWDDEIWEDDEDY